MDLFNLNARIGIDTSEYEQGLNNAKKSNAQYKSDIMTLANTYKQQGMNMSDAMKKAYAEIDKSQYDLSSHSETESKSFFSNWGDAAKKVVAAFGAVTAGATALKKVGELIKESLGNYAEYEQLTGGVETLFKDSADTVMQYAENAYKTSGLSANEYMKQVTSFSASLIQSTGRGAQQDTEQLKASLDEQYEATKQYLQDVYDAEKDSWDARIASARKYDEYAVTDLKHQKDEALKELKRANEAELEELKAHNKQSLEEVEAANSASVTTTEGLQRSAELADQIMTDMSDNANKMGTDMEAIQNAYNGFAKANFTMLDNLKLGYGGTKEEMQRLLDDAEKLSGIHFDLSSFADITEAIHVVQTEMGITGTTAKEAATTIEGSINTMKAAWTNLSTGFGNESANITQLVTDLMNSVVTVIANVVPRIGQILAGMVSSLPEMIGSIVDQLMNAVNAIMENPEAISKAMQAGADFLVNFIDGMFQNTAKFSEAALLLIGALSVALIQNIPQLTIAGGKLAMAIVKGIGNGLKTSSENLGHSIQGLFMAFDTGVLAVSDKIVGLGEKIATVLPEKIDAANQATQNFLTSLAQSFENGTQRFQETGKNIVYSINNGIDSGVQFVKYTVANLITNIVNGIQSGISRVYNAGISLVTSVVNGIKEKIIDIYNAALAFPGKVVEGVQQGIENVIQAGKDLIEGLWKGIQEGIDSIIDRIKKPFQNIIDTVKDILGIHSPSRVFADIGEQMVNGLSQGWNDAYGDFEKTIENSNARLSQLMSQRNLLTEQYNQKSAGLSDWDYARQMKLLNEKSARKKEIEDEMFQIRRTMENSRPVTVTKKSEPRPEQKSGSFTYTWGDYKKDHTKKSKNVHYTMADFVAALDEKYRKWVGKGVIEDVDPEDTKRAQESQVLGVLASAFNKQMQNTSADVINQFWSSTVDKLAEASESVKSLKIPKVETVSSPEIATVNNARNAFTTAPQMQSAPQAPQEYNFTINLDGKVLARETFREIDRQSNLAGQSLTRIVS